MSQNSYAYSEVYEIINLMSYDLRKKIPIRFINYIKKHKDNTYLPQIDRNIPLEEQNLRKETISIIAFLKLNCFCNEEEKKQFMKILNENERKHQEELREKYNPDNLFKNSNTEKQATNTSTSSEIVALKCKESIYTKIKKWLKHIFNKQ